MLYNMLVVNMKILRLFIVKFEIHTDNYIFEPINYAV